VLEATKHSKINLTPLKSILPSIKMQPNIT